MLKTTITIEATEGGIAFLKAMKDKMKAFAIDAARMRKAVTQNSKLEEKVKNGFKRNSNNQATEVKRVVITSKPWYIKKNALGVILYKEFYAQVAFKRKDGKFYIQRTRCVSNFENGSYTALKVYGSGPSEEILEKNINK